MSKVEKMIQQQTTNQQLTNDKPKLFRVDYFNKQLLPVWCKYIMCRENARKFFEQGIV